MTFPVKVCPFYRSIRPPTLLLWNDNPEAQLVELLLRHVGGGSGHRIHARLVLRKSERVADRGLVEERQRKAVDPRRDTAVRRRAHAERVQQEAEARPLLLARDVEKVEHLRLEVRLVDPERAARQLQPVS